MINISLNVGFIFFSNVKTQHAIVYNITIYSAVLKYLTTKKFRYSNILKNNSNVINSFFLNCFYF